MKVNCEKCNAEYNIDESRIPPEGLQIKCPKCLATFLVTKGGQAPQTAGDLFDIGDSGEDSLELDLPEEPEQPAAPGGVSSVGESTLPPIGGATPAPPSGASLPEIPDMSQTTPSPSPTPGAEGQIFDFIDHEIGSESDAQAQGPVRYRIRRKSGKVFGPFNVDTVNKMLAEHQLMGNEEASTDGHTYKPLGAFDEFAETIRQLMEEPATDSVEPGVEEMPADQAVASVEGSALDMAPKGIDFAEPPPAEKSGRSGGLLMIMMVSVIILVIGGLVLGFTKYGFFGYRLFTGSGSTSKVGSGGDEPDRSGVVASRAHKLFYEDSHAGYDSLIRNLEKKYKDGDESTDDLYLLALSYAAMLRNYGANEVYLGRGRNILERLKEDAPESPEAKKAEGAFLILTDPAKARKVLSALTGKDSRDKEALYLAGWAAAYQKKWRDAARFFDRATVIDPDYAKAYHALGDIQSLQGDFENALLFYEKALEKNPHHVHSGLEQARVLVEVKQEDEAGEQILKEVFGKKFRQLAPSERAKAHALRAKINIRRHKKEEVMQDLNAAIELVPSRVEYMAALGNFFLDVGQFSKAKELFDKAVSKDPQNVDALVGKGRAMWRDGDIVKAKVHLEKVSSQYPKDPRPPYLLGRIAEDLEKPQEALTFYRKSNNLSAKYLTARVAIARLHLKQNNLKEALNELTSAARSNPDSAVVRNGLGEVYMKQGNLRLALKEFEEALRTDPELASAHFNLGNVLRERGKYDEAIESYKKVEVLAPRYPDLVYEHAYTLFLKKQYPEALKMYEAAIRQTPNDDRLYVRAGMAADASGDTQAAIQYYQSASGLNASNTEAVFQLALVFERQKEYEKALDLFRQVAELDPKNAETHYHKGVCFLAQDMVTDAIDEFQSTISLEPNHVDALIELGKALADRLQFHEAIQHYNRVVKVAPQRIDVRVALGDAYYRQGLYPKAMKVFKQAYAKNPKFPELAYKLGRTYDDLGKRSTAAKFYQRALKLDPKNPMPHYYLGFVYKASRKNKKALGEFRRYLNLRPDAPDADEIRDEIYYLQHD